MSKISDAFKNGKALVGFVTAGVPTPEVSEEVIVKMAEGGCDVIEIGIPFSDPIAEDKVVQQANVSALSQGMTTDKVFELTERISNRVSTPLVYTAYLNVLFKYGYKRFLQRAKDAGVSGVIVPDMPFEEKGELTEVAEKYGIDVVSVIAPASDSRIKMIASAANGFVCEMPSEDCAGRDFEILTDAKAITKAVKDVTDVPVAISFGINTPEQAKKYAKYADGVIIGSAIVKIAAEHGENAQKYVFDYVKSMKDAIK